MNKKKLKKDIYNIASGMLCTHFDRNSIDQLELLKAIMVGTLTDYKKEKLSDILMRLLPSMEKDTFYRKISVSYTHLYSDFLDDMEGNSAENDSRDIEFWFDQYEMCIRDSSYSIF